MTVPRPIALSDIAAIDWSPRVQTPGAVVEAVDDIAQCLRIIVGTPPGSDPHRPDFACAIDDVLDRPLPEATPLIIREVGRACARWEPRAVVERVAVTADPARPGAAQVVIHWRPAGGGAAQQTAVLP